MEKLGISNKAIILGRGVTEIKENDVVVDYRLNPASENRVSAMAAYYQRHESAFRSKDSIIVASGGYARLAGGQTPPPNNHREGRKMADLLISYGVPHGLIETEINSGSTTENFQYIIEEGFFQKTVFDATNPLILVASKPHGQERGAPLARVGFGIEDWAGVGVLIAEAEPLVTRIKERIGGLATNISIQEIQPQPYSVDDMAAVGERFEELIATKADLAKLALGLGTDSRHFPLLMSTTDVMQAV